jgi:hypothetical protein
MERRTRCHRGRHAVAYTVTNLFMQDVEFPLAAQPAIGRFETGGTMSTIPMLERLADALFLRLNVEFLPLREASGAS